MSEKLRVLTDHNEIHLRFDPSVTFEEMRKEMAELIETYKKARKAMLNHYKHDESGKTYDLKSPEYKTWWQEKLRLDKEASLAYCNVATLARYFCPKIYIV